MFLPSFQAISTRDNEDASIVSLIIAYNVLQIFGLVSLSLTLVTALLSRRVYRASAWYVFIIVWIFYSLSYLLIAGQQTGGPSMKTLCTVQASLIYATPVMGGWATLALILQVYLSVSSVVSSRTVSRKITIASLVIPPLLAVGIFIEALSLALKNPDNVARSTSGMFCILTDGLSTKISAAFVVLSCVCIIVTEGLILVILYRNWHAVSHIRLNPNPNVSLTMILRITLFSIMPVVAIFMSLLFSLLHHGEWSAFATAQSNLLPASIPAAAGLIFGTQKDLFGIWMFWKKPTTRTELVISKPEKEVISA